MPGLLASVDDLRDVPGVTLDLDDEADVRRAQYLLGRASARVVAALGWDPLISERVHRLDRPVRTLWLPGMNVSAVDITEGSLEVTDYTWDSDGRIDFAVYGFRGALCDVEIAYTAGWALADMPAAISSAVLDGAASGLVNPQGARTVSWSTGSESESVTYAGDPTVSIEDPTLTPYRMPWGVA